jgi:hypothetical protein
MKLTKILVLALGLSAASCAGIKPIYKSMPPTPAGVVDEVYTPKLSLTDDVLARQSLDSIVDTNLSPTDQAAALIKTAEHNFELLLTERPLEGFSDKQVRGFEAFLRNSRLFPQLASPGPHHYGVSEGRGRDHYQSARFEMEKLWDDNEVRRILPRPPTQLEIHKLEKQLEEVMQPLLEQNDDSWYSRAQTWWLNDLRVSKAQRELRNETYDFSNIVREAWLNGISDNYINVFGYFDLALSIAPDEMADEIKTDMIQKHLELSEWYANPPESYRLDENYRMEDNEMFAVFEALEGVGRIDREANPSLATHADLTLAYALSGSGYYTDRMRAFDVYQFAKEEIIARSKDQGYSPKDRELIFYIKQQVSLLRLSNLLYQDGSISVPGLWHSINIGQSQPPSMIRGE